MNYVRSIFGGRRAAAERAQLEKDLSSVVEEAEEEDMFDENDMLPNLEALLLLLPHRSTTEMIQQDDRIKERMEETLEQKPQLKMLASVSASFGTLSDKMNSSSSSNKYFRTIVPHGRLYLIQNSTNGKKAYNILLYDVTTGKRMSHHRLVPVLFFLPHCGGIIWQQDEEVYMSRTWRKGESEDFDELETQWNKCTHSIEDTEEETKWLNQSHRYTKPPQQKEENEDEEESHRPLYQSRGRIKVEPSSCSSSSSSSMLVGNMEQSAFVTRGNHLEIFQSSNGQMDLKSTMRLYDPNQPEWKMDPSQVLLHQQDTRLLLLDPKHSNKVSLMDLEYQKVISHFGVNDTYPIHTIAPSTKDASVQGTQTFLCANANSLFELDPRQHSMNKLARKYEYSKPPKFSCMAVDSQGHIITGTKTGEIRFFQRVGERAKTLLPGCGDAILGLDLSHDSEYALVTMENYLLVLKCKDAFVRSITSSFPRPIKLTLHPNDLIRHRIQKIQFSKASFNFGHKSGYDREQFIIVTTGPFLVVWDLEEVLKGNTSSYLLQKYDERITSGQFFCNENNHIALASMTRVFDAKLKIDE